MPVNEADRQFSPAWWMKVLTDRQTRRLQDTVGPTGVQKLGLNSLAAWMDNDPPLPEGAPSWQPAYQAFHKDTRTNVAALAVSSVRDRLTPLGFRTAAADDDNGDDLAAEVWSENRMPVQQVDLLTNMLGLRDAYTMVGPPKAGSNIPVITVQDPREVITAHDPARQQDLRAGMRTLYDPDEGIDACYIYLPADSKYNPTRATVYRAWRPSSRGTQWGENFRYRGSQNWRWDDPITLPCTRVPIARLENRGGVAEYEPHLSVLGRINRITLQRMLIGDIQAFRQRAIEGLPKFYPEGHPLAGQEIDYEGIFTPGPGSMWMVPQGAKFWESQPIDLRPLLDEEKMEYRTASALMGIPVSYFNPDDTNGSAEGASLQREGLVYRAEDRMTIAETGLNDTMSLAFEMMDERERMRVSQIETIWAPIERLSLTERFNAAVQAKAAGLARETIRRQVLKMTPREMDQARDDDAADMILGLGPAAEAAAAAQARQAALQVASTRLPEPGQPAVSRGTPAPAPAAPAPATR